MLAENLQQVNANIEKACAAVSRDPVKSHWWQ